MWDSRQVERAIRFSLKSIGIEVPTHWPNLKSLLSSKKEEVLAEYEKNGKGDILEFAVAMLTSDAMDALPTGTVTGLPSIPIEQINGAPISTHEGIKQAADKLKHDLIAKWIDRYREHDGKYPPNHALDKAEVVANLCVDTCCPDESQLYLTRKGKILERWYGEAVRRAEILLAVPELPEDVQEEYMNYYKKERFNLDNEIQSRAKVISLRQESMAVTRSKAQTTSNKASSQSGNVNDSLTSTETEDKRSNSSDLGPKQKRQKTTQGLKAREEVTNNMAVDADEDPGKEPYMADVELTFECEAPAGNDDPSKPGPSHRRASWPTQHAPCRDPRLVDDPTPEDVQTPKTPKRTKRLRKPLSRNIWSGGRNVETSALPVDDDNLEDMLDPSLGPTPRPSQDPTFVPVVPRSAVEEAPSSPVRLSCPSSPDPDPDPFFTDPDYALEEESWSLDRVLESREASEREDRGGPFDRNEVFEPVPMD